MWRVCESGLSLSWSPCLWHGQAAKKWQVEMGMGPTLVWTVQSTVNCGTRLLDCRKREHSSSRGITTNICALSGPRRGVELLYLNTGLAARENGSHVVGGYIWISRFNLEKHPLESMCYVFFWNLSTTNWGRLSCDQLRHGLPTPPAPNTALDILTEI